MRILVTNDDGIASEGLKTLASVLVKKGHNVIVVAPDGNRSAFSHSLSIHKNLVFTTLGNKNGYDEYTLDGTPADCVKVALRALLPFTPDVVLSGINDGMNAGLDVAYSGTVGAATEAALHGIPAIAVSMRNDKSFEVTDHYLPAVLEELLDQPSARGELWNVNFPTCPLSDCRGILRDRFPEKRSYYENYYHCVREENGVQYLSPKATVLRPDEVTDGSDIQAVLNGFVSIGKVRCAAF